MKPKRPTKNELKVDTGLRTGCLMAIAFAVVLWAILAVGFFAVSRIMTP